MAQGRHEAGANLAISSSCGPDRKQRLAVFHRLAIFDQDTHHFAADVRFNFIHQLHGFDDADHLPRLNRVAHLHERTAFRAGRGIERAHDGRLDDVQLLARELRRRCPAGAASGAAAAAAGRGAAGVRRRRRRRGARAAALALSDAEAFFSRMCRPPCSYSNSSRPCAVMKSSSVSSCPRSTPGTARLAELELFLFCSRDPFIGRQSSRSPRGALVRTSVPPA